MKRLLTVALTLALCMGLWVPALADGGWQIYTWPEEFYGEVGVPYPVTGGNLYGYDTGEIIGCDPGVTQAEIPAQIGEYTITGIRRTAFSNAKNLASIHIPAFITNISEEAFAGNSGLKEITVAPDNPKYTSVNGVLFSKDMTTLLAYPGGKEDAAYAIPAGVTAVDMWAFYGCVHLKEVTFPASLAELGGQAFSRLDSLTAFSVAADNPNFRSVDGLLYDKAGTTLVACPTQRAQGVVTLPDGVKAVGAYAFAEMDGLTGLVLPDGVTSVDFRAFYRCRQLTSVSFPDSLRQIGVSAFESCDGLTGAAIPEGVTNVGNSAFFNCWGLVSLWLPASLTETDFTAFSNTSGLRDLYYGGSQAQWEELNDRVGNLYLDREEVTIHYNSTPPKSVAGFRDVLSTDYYAEPVAWARETGVTTGKRADEFDPAGTLTRAEAVTFLWRAVGQPEPKSTWCPFTDVKAGAYYYKPVLWALEAGVTNGTGADTFSPNQNCTYGHIVTYLWRTAGKPNETGAGAWYQDGYNWADGNGLLKGTRDFEAWGNCPRSDTVTYLYRADQSKALAKAGERRYDFVLDNCSWTQAMAKAKAAGGTLARFETKEEYQAILKELEFRGMTNVDIRIGGKRAADGKDYYWVDADGNLSGPKLNDPGYWAWDQWQAGEPSYSWNGTVEEVLEIYYNQTQGAWVWNDLTDQVDAGGRFGYIIEY